MQQNHGVNDFRVLVNMAPDDKAALDIFRRLYKACDHFLSGVGLDYVGMIPRDSSVRKAVISQTPFSALDPKSPASKAMFEVSQTIRTWNVPHSLDGNIKFFWKRLLFAQ